MGDVAVRLPDVAVGLPAPNRRYAATLGVLDVEFLGEPRADQLLHERLALGADGRKLMRFPAHDEVAATHVWQARLGALQLLERVPEGHARGRLERRTRQARWRHAGWSALELARPLDAKRRHAVTQVNLPEAAHAQVLREIVSRPGRNPHLAAQRVDRFDRRHEIVVARDQHGRIEGADGSVVNHLGDEPRVDALLGGVLVVDAARRTAPRTAHPELPLDEVARA